LVAKGMVWSLELLVESVISETLDMGWNVHHAPDVVGFQIDIELT
jgi:hypothetical protein